MSKAIQRVITDAYRNNRPSKNKAKDILLDLIRQNEDNIMTDETVNIDYSTLVDIVSFFNPTTPRVPKTIWDFCYRAVDSNENRKQLRYIYAYPDLGLLGTNGKVLNWVNGPWVDSDVKYGSYYNKDGTPLSDLALQQLPVTTYPGDMTKFLKDMGIDDINSVETTRIHLNDQLKDTNNFRVALIKIGDSWFNQEFVDIACAGRKEIDMWMGNKGAVYFNPQPGWHSVVMPLHRPE